MNGGGKIIPAMFREIAVWQNEGIAFSVPIEESTPTKLRDEEIRGIYTRLLPLYGIWERLVETRARESALELAAVRDNEKVLEVGVGPGTALERLAGSNPGGTTIGADICFDMLQRTNQRISPALQAPPPLCQCDARSLPFADHSFDLVFSSYMLDLLSATDIAIAIQQMRRVLKPSGRLLLLHLSLGNRWFDRFWRFFYWLVPTLLGGCRPIRLAAYLPEAGFIVREVRQITQRGVPTEVIFASNPGLPQG